MKRFTLRNTLFVALLAACSVTHRAEAQVTTETQGTSDYNNPDREVYMRPSYWRPYDQRGINVFETTKDRDSIPFLGPRLRFGAGFTQQFQDLEHENPDALNNATSNRLYPISAGFMTAQANLFLDAELSEGIRLNVTTYLSSRHHNEAWVKGGYIQFDRLPFRGQFWDNLMDLVTVKVGHMEINYGDQHFRRSDGGHTLYNPFMENYIVDAFATEIGGEVYVQKAGLMGMVGVSNGMIRGNVDYVQPSVNPTTGDVIDANTSRNPSIYLKLAADHHISDRIRARLAGSYYHNNSSAGSGLTLYGGDRAGSNYHNVMERAPVGATLPSSTALYTSGRLNPGFSKKIHAFQVNGFLKAYGFEFFGTYETANGRTKTETAKRDMNQWAADLIFRFGPREQVYIGGRYNGVNAELSGIANEVKVSRVAAAAGWFLTRNILLKGEYVQQEYEDFPTTDFRAGGKFNGIVIEAVVGF
ncbi:MAG TPA: hypothetical protein VGE66_13935 [Chitinophagaceae bacterium]